jgi:hypothetical protein
MKHLIIADDPAVTQVSHDSVMFTYMTSKK